MKAAALPRAAKSVRKDAAEPSSSQVHAHEDSPPIAFSQSAVRRVRLTLREREVLTLLCEGLSNKLIARLLKISAGTVKVHISSILRALNVSTRLQAVLLARDSDLVPLNGDDDERFPHAIRATHR